MPDTLTERPYQSGGSAPTYAALDTARNNLDALEVAKDKAMNAIRSALWDLQEASSANESDRLSALEHIADALSDMCWDREQELREEIEALEIEMED